MLNTSLIPTVKKSAVNLPNPYYYTEEEGAVVQAAPVYHSKATYYDDKSLQVVESLLQKMEMSDTAVSQYFSKEGMERFNKIAGYGEAMVLPARDSLRCISVDGYTEVRSVPMRFSFPNNQRSFVEDLVFVFDSANLICDVRFALSDEAIADITGKSARFGSTFEKYFLIGFMEKYKTAYALEDLEFIDKVFAENALIIVGEMVPESHPEDAFYRGLNEYQVEYQRYSKKEYVEHLDEIFSANEFVNIQFEDNEVRKVNSNDMIYGIQIKQNYYSTRYSDQGYLFLMMDLNDKNKPTIYVRTWQPEKNGDDKLYGLEDFSF